MENDDSWSAKEWLKSFGLQRYLNSFLVNGYETKKLCSKLKDEDLDEMKITDKTHRSILFNQSDMLRTGSDRPSSTAGSKSPDKSSPPQSHSSSADLQNVEAYSAVFDDISEDKKSAANFTKPSKLMDKKKVSSFDKSEKAKPKVSVKRIKSASAIKPGSRPSTSMTKLELKLLLREFVQRDGLVLSEPPYSNENGSANIPSLAERAEIYAEELNIESLTVMDAMEDVWRYKVNRSSEYVIPARVGKSTKSNPGSATSNGSFVFQDQGTYSEPFDSKSSPKAPPPLPSSGNKTPNMQHTSTSSPGILRKSPNSPSCTEQQSGYLDPFDALDGGNPVIVKTSPLTERKKPVISPKPTKLRSNSVEAFKHSKDELSRMGRTLPPESPSLSTHSSSSDDTPAFEKSPKNKRSWVPFRKSGKTPEVQRKKGNINKRFSGSMDDMDEKVEPYLNNRPVRQSLPAEQGMLKMPRSISTNPALLYRQSLLLEDLKHSKKKFGGSQGSINQLNSPKTKIDEAHKAGIPSPPSPNTKSRVKALTLAGDRGSELELSTLLEVYVAGSAAPMYFRKEQSSDLYEDVDGKETDENTGPKKQKKQGGVISRLFKKKDKKNKSMSESQENTSDDNEADGNRGVTKGLTNSQSLPDIQTAVAEAQVRSEYTEIYDILEPVKKTQTTPPKLPTRFRSHSYKTHTSSPSSSPQTSPPTHHKLMVKSDSASSNEIIQSLPSSGDDVIELRAPTSADATYDEPWTRIPLTRSPNVKQSNTSKSKGSSSSSPKGGCSTMISPVKKRRLFDGTERHPSKTLPRYLSETNMTMHGSQPVSKPRTLLLSERSLTSEDSPLSSVQCALSPNSDPFSKPQRDGNQDLPCFLIKQKSESVIEKLKHTGIIYEGSEAGYTPPVTPTEDKESEKGGVEVPREVKDAKDDISFADVEEIPLKQKKHQNKKKSLQFQNRSSLELTLESILEDEGIDLTQIPYSNLKGEYTIPTALVSRYAQESHTSEEEVVKALDSIRRTQLIKCRRGHIPLKKNWKNFMDINTSSLEDFLVSIGLPQYYDTISEQGYLRLSDLKGTTNGRLNSLPLKESHRKQLCAFVKRL